MIRYFKCVLPFLIWLILGAGLVFGATGIGGLKGGSWKMVGKNDNIIVKGPIMAPPRQSAYIFGTYVVGSAAVCLMCGYFKRRRKCVSCGCTCGCCCSCKDHHHHHHHEPC